MVREEGPVVACSQDDSGPKIDVRMVREFAMQLLKGTSDNDRETWFIRSGLKGCGIEALRFSATFPMWMLSSVCYYMMQLKTTESAFADFSSGIHCAPSFDTLEYRRGKYLTALVDGYFNTTITATDDEDNEIKIPVILSTSSGGGKVYVSVYCNKEDGDVVQQLFNQFKANVDMIPFLKNEKLLLTKYNAIQFLKYPNITREELILPARVWEILDRNLFFVAANREKMIEHNLDWKRGILIWGEPGTGKTLFGRVICNEVKDMTVMWVTPRCIDDESDISKIFEIARKLSPTVLFMEDLDFFAANRQEYGPSYILGELLNQLDGLTSNDGIFVIGTTNMPKLLDKAIGSRPARFDIKIKFDLPSPPDREKMYKLFIGSQDGIDYTKLSANSDKLTGAHIRETVVRGVLTTLKDPSVPLQKAILEGIRNLRDEELFPSAPGGLIT